MLKIARNRGVYAKLIQDKLGDERLELPEGKIRECGHSEKGAASRETRSLGKSLSSLSTLTTIVLSIPKTIS